MQIKPRGPAFESFEQLFCNFNISYTHVFVTRERAHVNVLETQTNWNHSIYRCINNVADAKCKRSLRKFGSWITFPTPHFFPCCTLNEVQWYVEGGRERAWTVNPENSDSRIRKMPAIANPTLPFPPRYPPFSRINLSRTSERFRIWFLLSFEVETNELAQWSLRGMVIR